MLIRAKKDVCWKDVKERNKATSKNNWSRVLKNRERTQWGYEPKQLVMCSGKKKPRKNAMRLRAQTIDNVFWKTSKERNEATSPSNRSCILKQRESQSKVPNRGNKYSTKKQIQWSNKPKKLTLRCLCLNKEHKQSITNTKKWVA